MEERGWEYRRRQPEGTVLYEAVRDNLATLLAEAGERGRGLPRYVERDFAKYLECGVLAHGFARVRCESCKDELLVAFSCKGRGVCPSCNAKRAHVTAVHLVERVLPHVPYRQWTLSFPHRVRWVLLKDVGLLSDVLTLFLRVVFALQVTPHFHSLVPDGVFVPWEGGVRFAPLPPPTQAEVERLLRVVRHRVLRLLEKRGALPAQGPEDALEAYQAHSLQQRLRWTEVELRPPPRKQPRCAFLEGFSLHANTHLHANDRQGLERLCRYGARGALALERLSRAEDGRIAYRMKRPLPDGTTHLLFTGLELLRRLASLVPPPRANLTRFHGVFAPGAKVRPFLLPQSGAEPGLEEESPAIAATVEEPRKEGTPRLDWAGLLRRTFALEVFACLRCGGRLKGVGVREGSRRGESDSGAPGVAHGECAPGPCARAAPERVVLKLKAQAATASQESQAPAASRLGRRLGWRVSAGDEWLLRRPGVRLMGYPSTRQRPSPSALLPPATPNRAPVLPMLRPALVRWARSRLGPEAASVVGGLDWEQLSWSGAEGRYLAPPRSPAGWSLRLAVPEPLQLTASLTLEPGACLTPSLYGADAPTAEEGALALEGPWWVELRLSAGDKTEPILLTGIPRLVVAWGRDAGRPQARLIAEHSSGSFEFDLPIPQGTSEHTWSTLTRSRPSRPSKAWQDLLLALLSRGDVPARQREAAVKLLATERQHLHGSVQSALRSLLLTKRLLPKEAAALDLVAPAHSEGSKAPALFTVGGDAPPRLWVDGQELSGWAPHTRGFEVGTALHGFVLVRVEWPGGETQDFWAALGPGVRLHLRTDQGPRQESPPEGERCVTVEGTDARWSCETESLPRQGPLRCPSPAYLQSAIALQSKRKNGAEASLAFVPGLPGRYTFRWHGPHLDGRWAPGCASR